MSALVESLENRQFLSAAQQTIYARAVDGSLSKIGTIPAGGSITDLVQFGPFARVTSNGTLLVEGTGGKDKITVTLKKPSNVIVQSVSLVPVGSDHTPIYVNVGDRSYGFALANVKRIRIEGMAGNDTLSVDSNVNRRAVLVGGKGNDNLNGGRLGDTLSGGDGNDSLAASSLTFSFVPAGRPSKDDIEGGNIARFKFVGSADERKDSADFLGGGAGNDTLYAGNGPDTCNGGAGSDRLIAVNRGNPPKGLPDSGEVTIDYDGLTVSSMEAVDQQPGTTTPNGLVFTGSSKGTSFTNLITIK